MAARLEAGPQLPRLIWWEREAAATEHSDQAREAKVEEENWNSYDCLPRSQFLKTMPPSDKGFWYWGVGFLKDLLHINKKHLLKSC